MALARRVAVLSGVAISALAEIAGAEEPARPVHVAVKLTRAPGADGCISPDEVVARTKERASADILLTVEQKRADFFVLGHVEPRAGGFRTELVLRDAHGRALGERTIDSPARSCRALDESLTLALVLLVETPRVRAAAQTKATEPLDELPPPLYEEAPAPRIEPLRLPPPPPHTRTPWVIDVGLGASVPIGFTPVATVGPSLFGMVHVPHFVPVAVRGAAYPLGTDRKTVPGEGISVRGVEGGVELCPLDLGRTRVNVLACAGAHYALLHAEPLGPQSRDGSLGFLVLPLRVEVRGRAGAFAPFAAVAARFAPTSPAFVYRVAGASEQPSFSVPAATAELDVGLSWRAFP
ncbi:hypothetical protein AKJ09_09107 [Labilithrix luteola]|uniref:Uncharacterized protein n=1 Tax=Labilithrix luteola TaxID=1391654 RepID=A0A0K1Q9N1_9BACT|nr:hypothetical protein [Labilithrix luteola]AKV02444.1 hypothetical protein AKJ09_09107 [Labilithrix luteola]